MTSFICLIFCLGMGLGIWGLNTPCFADVDGKPANTNDVKADQAADNTKSALLVKKAYEQMQKQDFAAAVKLLCQAVKLDRNNMNIRRYLAYALIQTGSPVAAIDQLNLICSHGQPTVYDHCALGEALLHKGDYEKSKASFQTALSLQSSCRDAKGGLIKVAVAGQEYDAADKMCDQRLAESTTPADKHYFQSLKEYVYKAKTAPVDLSKNSDNNTESTDNQTDITTPSVSMPLPALPGQKGGPGRNTPLPMPKPGLNSNANTSG